MWKRLRIKALRPRFLKGKRQNQSSCSQSKEELAVEECDRTDPEDPDLIKDSRKMSFPYLDKCSCGSPGLGSKEAFRKSDSIRRKNTLISEISKKHDAARKAETCETAENEYTKPESNVEDRKKGGATTAASTTTKTTAVITTTNSSNHGTRNDGELTQNALNTLMTERQRKLQTSVQRSSAGLEDSDVSDEDLDTSTESRPEKEQRNSGGSSDYTSLAFDVNYVKVSPPKLTRRQKTLTEKVPERKPNRGSRLAGLKPSESAIASCSTDVELRRNKVVQPPTPSFDDGGEVFTPGSTTSPVKDNLGSVVGAQTNQTDEKSSQNVVKDFPEQAQGLVAYNTAEPGYISLQELQKQIKKDQGAIVVSDTERHEPLPKDLSPQKRGRIVDRSTFNSIKSLLEDQSGDSVALFQDGDNSILEFTFTVRLENDVIRRMRPEDAGNSCSNSGSPVMSGSVNIMKSDSSAMTVLKPVITVGMRNFVTDGVDPRKTDLDGSGLSRRNISELEPPSKHLATSSDSRTLMQSRDGPDGRSKTSEGSPRTETNEVEGKFGPAGRSLSEGRGISSDGAKTVTWAFDKPGDAARRDDSKSKTTRPVGKDHRSSVEQSETLRKQQTLADFMSNQQTKITTVAIVHKSADFDGLTEGSMSSQQSTPHGGTLHSNKGTPERSRNRVPTQIEQEPELTHMSWDEVMNEAKALGIPLNRPGSGSVTKQRRSSVASDAGDMGSIATIADQKMTTSWACPNCRQESENRRNGTEKPTSKKGSPFKERFKLQNLFSRKQKDEDGGKSKDHVTTTTARSSSKSPHQVSFHTIPSGGGFSRTTSGGDEHCCQRCLSAGKSGKTAAGAGGTPGAPGVGGSQVNKTLSPGRMQSPLRMSLFSGGTNQKKSAGVVECAQTVHRSGSQWSSPSRRNNVGTSSEVQQGNLESSTLSPKQRPGNNNDFLKSLEQLKTCGWYWGPLGFEEAEVRLSGKPDGAFLVRDSSDDRYILSLSFRSQGTTHHTRIEHYRGMFSFYAQQNIHEAATIVEFIANAMRHSQDGKCLYYLRPRSPSSPPAPVQLLYPVSRFQPVPSLKHLAEAATLRLVRRSDHIDRLPLPRHEKDSLRRLHHHQRQTRHQRAAP